MHIPVSWSYEFVQLKRPKTIKKDPKQLKKTQNNYKRPKTIKKTQNWLTIYLKIPKHVPREIGMHIPFVELGICPIDDRGSLRGRCLLPSLSPLMSSLGSLTSFYA
jgi:hypothetical protein